MAQRAKQLALNRHTSVSALSEEFVRAAALNSDVDGKSFVEKRAGKFQMAKPMQPDARLEVPKARYHTLSVGRRVKTLLDTDLLLDITLQRAEFFPDVPVCSSGLRQRQAAAAWHSLSNLAYLLQPDARSLFAASWSSLR